MENRAKNVFKIPITWEMYAEIEIEAETLDDAIKLAENNTTSSPTDGLFVEGSCKVKHAIIPIINK